ncbi:MAG: SDR family NAD(P)-dependent oxidoreductase [Clostridia bacterium]|nr:SDR family NAD(P)-dependent oxidoreductase [Clostridia bacterium]
MNKTVCLTGAAGGLGSSFARVCLEEGWQVLAGDLQENARTEMLAREYGEAFAFHPLDVSDPESVRSYADWVRARTAQLDLLMNAAGYYTPNSNRRFEEFDIEKSMEMYSINALGPLRMLQQLLELVLASEDKVVVNISSEAGSMAGSVKHTWRYDYGMSKAALNLATTILHRQYREKGIRFLLVHPGWMRTEMGGMRATLEPEVSAREIFRLIQREKHCLDNNLFMDYNGTPRPW